MQIPQVPTDLTSAFKTFTDDRKDRSEIEEVEVDDQNGKGKILDVLKLEYAQKYSVADITKSWASLHDFMSQVLEFTMQYHSRLAYNLPEDYPGNKIYFHNEFDSNNETAFEQLSSDRVLGVSAIDTFEAGILLAFCQAMVDHNPYPLDGFLDECPLELMLTVPEAASLISERAADQMSTLEQEPKHPLNLPIVQELNGFNISQPGILTITRLFKKTNLSDIYAGSSK